MGWRTLLISQHAKISLTSGNLVIQTDSDRYHTPIRDINVLLIQSLQVVITTAAVAALAEAHAKIIFTGRDGQPICETAECYPHARTAALVRQQVGWSEGRIENLWTRVVAAKIQNQIAVGNLLEVSTMDLSSELEKLELNDATNREAVVARQYFPLIFGKDFSRSDLVPINAALNYGYSILLSLVNRIIVSRGYLTCFGIHHDNACNAFNLASDLMEPFRPIIDYWVAQQKILDLTPDVKFGLARLFELEMRYNGKKEVLSNVVEKVIVQCLKYLSEETETIRIEVDVPDEVSNYAINDYV
ncbi:type II CRISPR-associated endonuclease Cas1 [Levilactobacillus brevis]|uniref:type II CRISPR-associated endonuclease Cas1 n=1 Tax=Levilactobacillus brevis TaxID=1580 RepID=UPI001BAA64EE|nr:type II CRISPR-associated endonuclease Cas1 [Levilactobacillus brevis]MBS1006491.1 type II CRISPR-associated endonuclease Cas1 [Levilactobacillus brevis]MBS1013549.1 type II CRISPR-associated endonuclease Cas1 [Levilactobacillus brevis]